MFMLVEPMYKPNELDLQARALRFSQAHLAELTRMYP